MSAFLQQVRENVAFVGVCVAVFAVIFVLAEILERLVIRGKRKAWGARYVAFIAMFAAFGGVLMLLEIPLFFAPGFYKMDLSELPVLLCGFYLGPVAGVVAEFLKVFIKLLIKGTSTAFVGDFANFVVGCTLVLPATAVYHAKKNKRMAILGMAAGTVCMTCFGSFFNALYLIPQFSKLFGMPLDVIVGMGTAVNPSIVSVPTLVLFAVVPFNLLKGTVVSVLTFLLYKRLARVFFREKA